MVVEFLFGFHEVRCVAVRDYDDFERRLRELSLPNLEQDALGEVDGCAIYRLMVGGGPRAKRQVLITAGLHGDESAGPESVLRFLYEYDATRYSNFGFLILPCINPFGYVHDTRENGTGIDLNRVFEVDNPPEEARLVKAAVAGERFDFAIDFHEDWEAAGFYFYEGRKSENWIGPEVIKNVESVCPIDREHDESDLPIADGVFKVDPGWGLQGFTPYLLAFHSDHVMICETPTSLPMRQRTAAHLKALETVLRHYDQANE